MRQFHSLDRLFLDIESPETSVGITALYFYDPTGLPEGKFDYDLIVEHINQVMLTIPVMCGKLHRSPLDLDNPYLVEQPNFHAADHIIHHEMEDTNSIKELSRVTNDYQYTCIDTKKPLWDALIISNINVKTLPKDAFAIAVKMHHTIADGMTGIDLTCKLHGLVPIGKPVSLPNKSELEAGGILGLGTRIISNNIKQSIKMLKPISQVGPQLGMKLINRSFDTLTNVLAKPEQTRFANPLNNNRVWGYAGFEIKKLKQMQSVLPTCTLNDLACTIISGAIREYLEYKNETPQSFIKALAPLNTRTKGQEADAGNEINIMSLDIPIHIEDPLEALVTVNKASTLKKQEQEKIGPQSVSELAKNVPPALLSYISLITGKNGIANLAPASIGNIVISNVRGPDVEMNLLGAKMTNFTGLAPVMDGIGAFFAVVSYNGTLNISVSSSDNIIEEPKYFIDCLERSFSRLENKISTRLNPAKEMLKPAKKSA